MVEQLFNNKFVVDELTFQDSKVQWFDIIIRFH